MLKISWATVQCYTYSSLISAAFLFRWTYMLHMLFTEQKADAVSADQEEMGSS